MSNCNCSMRRAAICSAGVGASAAISRRNSASPASPWGADDSACVQALRTDAVTPDPSQAKSFGESLAALRETPAGEPLLAAVALGLVAYAMYEFIEARYRRIAH